MLKQLATDGSAGVVIETIFNDISRYGGWDFARHGLVRQRLLGKSSMDGEKGHGHASELNT